LEFDFPISLEILYPVNGDFTNKLNFTNNYFDIISSMQSLYFIKSEVKQKILFKEIDRILKIGGKTIYNKMGENLYSGVITNLGRIKMPKILEEELEDFQFFPAPSPKTKVGCAISSFMNMLYVNFGRNCKESELEKVFFRKLVKKGIPIKIETN